ncbi:DUF418 domain-containing protein [Sphingomonas oligophenolica]|uniref:DUF418 domain-containing protein n=1 Tax=Sphingomonas oligophenolica TaxID=301154 RepID=A0A502CS29_9SPHN|nr:DUF418 domain-containing protein [Sphingomonas oligophenolica]TPG14521.1 DUF418 domain-containing protein [Sphingomonas oligophenolica]
MTHSPASRIVSLDVIRGVAVMGILVANLPAFGLPEAAYFSPLAWGGSTGWNRAVWFANFVLVEGKMRGLFTFLFGASMLVVIDAAEARGQSGAAVHFRRMATLFLIGCLHLYLFWWGDILSHYALVGAAAFLFARIRVPAMVAVGVALIALQFLDEAVLGLALLHSAARDTPAHIATWNAFSEGFGLPPAPILHATIAGVRGGFGEGIAYRWTHEASPLTVLRLIGGQTLGSMVFGMAGYRSGFLTGAWSPRRYALIAAICLGLTVPAYVALALATIAHGFDQRWVYLGSIVASDPIRPLTVVGYAALLMLAIRPLGAFGARIAAVGRVAFTNYLGTTLMMTFVFSGWGLGQFARWTRADLYWLAPLAWGIMLVWSPWWLRRYRYGPFEWAWRSLSRGRLQPMRLATA